MNTKLTLEANVVQERAPFVRVLTPCTLDCKSFPWLGKTFCRGCLRTSDEIREWQTMGQQKRAEVWDKLPERRAKLRG